MQEGEHNVYFAKGITQRNQNRGNEEYRRLIVQRADSYEQSNNHENKRRIVTEIIQYLRGEGARFLHCPGTPFNWEELCQDETKKKVSQALRDEVRRRRTTTARQTNHPRHSSSSPNRIPRMEQVQQVPRVQASQEEHQRQQQTQYDLFLLQNVAMLPLPNTIPLEQQENHQEEGTVEDSLYDDYLLSLMQASLRSLIVPVDEEGDDSPMLSCSYSPSTFGW